MQSPTGVHPAALELAALLRPTWPQINERIDASGHPTCRTTDPEQPLKDKLTRIEAELAEQRDARVGAVRERDEARDAFAGSESLSQDSDEFKAAQSAVAKVGSIDDRIHELQAMQVATLKMLGKDAPDPQRGSGRDRGDDPRGAAWNSGALLADEDLRRRLATASASKAKFGGIEIGEVASRDALVADITGTTAMRRGEYGGITPQLRRRLSVLDLIPTGSMDQNSFPYTKESGSFATALETAEGAAKPEAALTLTDDEAFAATIAHWLKIRKQALADAPALQAVIDGRLRYGVLRRLEGQVLNGDGLGANIRGILQTTGLGAVTFTAGALVSDQILKGITTVYLADAEATGIVLHPTDWQTALMAKSTYTAQAGVTGGSGEYFSGGPFEVTAREMWGVPLIPSAAVAQGTALVGDFAIGAMLLVREGVQVLLSDADGTDFTQNRVTMLAEMRAALPVFRPAAFATVALQ